MNEEISKVGINAESTDISKGDTLSNIAQQLEQGPEVPELKLDESKIIEVPEGSLPQLKQHVSKEFDPTEIQSALVDDNSEGGVHRNRTSGNLKSLGPVEEEGYVTKTGKNIDRDPSEDGYEVSGFMVEYHPDPKSSKIISVNVRNYFDDMETAMASINGDKYLMPLSKVGFKIATITNGAPTISYKSVMMYQYIDNKWRHV